MVCYSNRWDEVPANKALHLTGRHDGFSSNHVPCSRPASERNRSAAEACGGVDWAGERRPFKVSVERSARRKSQNFGTNRVHSMTPRRSLLCLLVHAIPTVGLLLQGLLYLTTSTFMPYHADALAVTWDQLPPHHRGFVLGVIRGMGAGSVAVAVALIIFLSIPLRRGDRWAYWAVPLVGVVFTSLTAYAAYTIDRLTPASTPWPQTLGLTAAYAAGALISYWPRRGVRPPLGGSTR